MFKDTVNVLLCTQQQELIGLLSLCGCMYGPPYRRTSSSTLAACGLIPWPAEVCDVLKAADHARKLAAASLSAIWKIDDPTFQVYREPCRLSN